MTDNNNTEASKSVGEQAMDNFALSFELTGVGWAHAKASVGAATFETEVSYLTRDPLGQLAHVLIAYIWPEDKTLFVFNKGGVKIDPEELQSTSFTWEDEPGGWKWTLRPHGAMAVKVRLEVASSRPGGTPLVNSICSLREMASACAGCIEGLLLKHGIVGYRLTWPDGDLPLAQYLLLKRWLQTPQYIARSDEKSIEVSTWHADMSALRLLGD